MHTLLNSSQTIVRCHASWSAKSRYRHPQLRCVCLRGWTSQRKRSVSPNTSQARRGHTQEMNESQRRTFRTRGCIPRRHLRTNLPSTSTHRPVLTATMLPLQQVGTEPSVLAAYLGTNIDNPAPVTCIDTSTRAPRTWQDALCLAAAIGTQRGGRRQGAVEHPDQSAMYTDMYTTPSLGPDLPCTVFEY